MSEHHIVVVGGGAGGLELASKLGRKYGSSSSVKITLVDRNLTHIWKPLLHEVAAGALDADMDGVDYRVQAAAAGFRFQPGELTAIDRDSKTLTLAPIRDDGGHEIVAARTLQYNHLVLAIGSVTNDFGTTGAAEHCYFLDSVKQAKKFHHTLMNTFLALQSERYPRPLRVGIVGAGATGVELAAELHKSAELIRSYGFDDFDLKQLEIVLIEAGERILPALSERIAAAASRELAKLGVKIRVNTAVESVNKDGFVTRSGDSIEAAIKVWAAGVRAPDFLANFAGLETNRGNQLVVTDVLQTTRDASGVNANVLHELRHYIPIEVLSSALNLTKRTLSQKANAHVMLSSRQSDMLLHLVRIWTILLSFFDNDRELLLAWLDNEVSDLDGAKPRLLLGSTYGRKVLLESVSNKAGC